jgi:hydrogenase nickel incorporation protein HypA/HybF
MRKSAGLASGRSAEYFPPHHQGFVFGVFMHEMSIVTNILAIAQQQGQEAGAVTINRIEIEVGALAGVEIPSLEFCFGVARTETLAAGAELVVHEIPGRGWCPVCTAEVPLDFFVAVCPDCGESVTKVLQGRELRVRSINVD